MTPRVPVPTEAELLARAERLLGRAWSPYSGIRVACVVLAADGSVHEGVNVENTSLGLTVCAERNALFAAVTAGIGPAGGRPGSPVTTLLFTSNSDEVVVPCGACRQVIAELAPEAVLLFGRDGVIRRRWPSIEALLPEAFDGRWKGPAGGGDA